MSWWFGALKLPVKDWRAEVSPKLSTSTGNHFSEFSGIVWENYYQYWIYRCSPPDASPPGVAKKASLPMIVVLSWWSVIGGHTPIQRLHTLFVGDFLHGMLVLGGLDVSPWKCPTAAQYLPTTEYSEDSSWELSCVTLNLPTTEYSEDNSWELSCVTLRVCATSESSRKEDFFEDLCVSNVNTEQNSLDFYG